MTERFNTLSDAIIAIAMTILVLEIESPTKWNDLPHFLHYLLLFVVSFIVIANIWYKRAQVMNAIKESNTPIMTLDMIGHLGICLIPLFTKMMYNFEYQSLAVGAYGLLTLGISSLYKYINVLIIRYDLLKEDGDNKKIYHRMRSWYIRISIVMVLLTVIAIIFPSFGFILYTIMPLSEFWRRYKSRKFYAEIHEEVPNVFNVFDKVYLQKERKRRNFSIVKSNTIDLHKK